MHRFIALLALAASASAQQALVPSLLEYLDLTATQVTRLRQNAADYHRFYVEKATRYQQVASELAEEHARDVVDPLALGQRYVEQEAICRELRAAYEQNYTRNQTVLTAAQKTRLSALDAVWTNVNLTQSATAQNLIEGQQGGGIFDSLLLSGLGGLGSGLGFGFSLPGGSVVSGGLGFGIGGLGIGGLCGVPTVSSNPVLLSREKPKAEVK